MATSREWGISVIHDITNVLRVGDITFMRPSEEGRVRDAIYRTVELKTRARRRGRESKRTVKRPSSSLVTVIGNEPLPLPGAACG